MSIFWLVVFVALFFLELFAPTFFCVFFAFGAFSAFIVSMFEFSLLYQVVTFLIASVISLILFRKKLKSVFVGDKNKKSDTEHFLYGQQGTVIKPITQNVIGEVSVADSFWQATSEEEIQEGTLVSIIGATENDSLILKVSTIKR